MSNRVLKRLAWANVDNDNNKLNSVINILRKSLATHFGDSQFRRNGFFKFIISKIYVCKHLCVR